MEVVECFQCESWIDKDCAAMIGTIMSDSSDAPSVPRWWCLTCLEAVVSASDNIKKELDKLDTNEVSLLGPEEELGELE